MAIIVVSVPASQRQNKTRLCPPLALDQALASQLGSHFL